MFISFYYYYYILNLHVLYIIINGNLKYLLFLGKLFYNKLYILSNCTNDIVNTNGGICIIFYGMCIQIMYRVIDRSSMSVVRYI